LAAESGKRVLIEDTLEGSIADSSWVLARMSSAGGSSLNSMMEKGRIYYDAKEKVISVMRDSTGFNQFLKEFGSTEEVDRFMAWVAANRANKLMEEGRENLFTQEEIDAGMKLNTGSTKEGYQREVWYDTKLKQFEVYRDDILHIAEQAGLLRPAMTYKEALIHLGNQYNISIGIVLNAGMVHEASYVEVSENPFIRELREALDRTSSTIHAEITDLLTSQRQQWMDEFYVPFYRIMEDEIMSGAPIGKDGLTRQEAYKRLKGGKENLNDLLVNTILNFHHLLQASLKNIAADKAIDNAIELDIARPLPPRRKKDPKKHTWMMVKGRKVWFEIDDTLTFKAISALHDGGLDNTVMNIGRGFKRFFTKMVTITPQFAVANGLRDMLSAISTSPVSYNPLKNITHGMLTYNNDMDKADMMASGASFSFGHVYGQEADKMKADLKRSMRKGNVLNEPALVPDILIKGWRKYEDALDVAENINRAAIYKHNIEAGKGKLKAAFEARDLIDFSAKGDALIIRMLVDLVPFLNARIQGADKLYRSGVKPSAKALTFQADASDKKAAKRFSIVTGALSLASIALFLHNWDDEEYRKLEDWQRDTYWVFRWGDKMFFLPKPFEVGAIATMAERLAEQAIDPTVAGSKFGERLWHTLSETFAFDPTPHILNPMLEVAMDKNKFTRRPIEGPWMDRMSPSLRSRPETSVFAQNLSEGMEGMFGLFGHKSKNLALSPLQIDHLIRAYTGQVGASTVATADTIWRNAAGNPMPARRWHEYQPIRRFYRDLTGEENYNRYSTMFYDAQKRAMQAHSDLKVLDERGDTERYQDTRESEKVFLEERIRLNRVRKRLQKINIQMKEVKLDKSLSSEAKRLELEHLKSRRNLILEREGKRLEKIALKQAG
jgi:hypothetical protein